MASGAVPPPAIPYAFARTHGVLAAGEEGGAVLVLVRPDATAEGIAELRRVLKRPVRTRAVDAERFAVELARAYDPGTAPSAALAIDTARDADLSRLMQELPRAEDLPPPRW